VDLSDLVSPIASTDWNKVKFGNNESTFYGNLDFLGELSAETNVTILITDCNDSLETSSLTGLSLLLD